MYPRYPLLQRKRLLATRAKRARGGVVAVSSQSAHLRTVARTIISPCGGLAPPTPPLPARPLWEQGGKPAGGRAQTSGRQGVADKSATHRLNSLVITARLVKGFVNGAQEKGARLCGRTLSARRSRLRGGFASDADAYACPQSFARKTRPALDKLQIFFTIKCVDIDT